MKKLLGLTLVIGLLLGISATVYAAEAPISFNRSQVAIHERYQLEAMTDNELVMLYMPFIEFNRQVNEMLGSRVALTILDHSLPGICDVATFSISNFREGYDIAIVDDDVFITSLECGTLERYIRNFMITRLSGDFGDFERNILSFAVSCLVNQAHVAVAQLLDIQQDSRFDALHLVRYTGASLEEIGFLLLNGYEFECIVHYMTLDEEARMDKFMTLMPHLAKEIFAEITRDDTAHINFTIADAVSGWSWGLLFFWLICNHPLSKIMDVSVAKVRLLFR